MTKHLHHYPWTLYNYSIHNTYDNCDHIIKVVEVYGMHVILILLYVVCARSGVHLCISNHAGV